MLKNLVYTISSKLHKAAENEKKCLNSRYKNCLERSIL